MLVKSGRGAGAHKKEDSEKPNYLMLEPILLRRIVVFHIRLLWA